MGIVEGLMVWLLVTTGRCMNLYDDCVVIRGLDICNETYIMDESIGASFNTSSIGGLKEFLKFSQVNTNEYDFDTYHCVNFTNDLIEELNYYGFNATQTELRGNNTYDHAIVSVFMNDKVVFVEPQSDEIFNFTQLNNEFNHTDIIVWGLIGEYTILSFNGWLSDSTKGIFEVEI
ncbi:MAG: hypothetical protein GQ477_04325 [Nanohaloarchaea archaeon]|nr:hypothetical protein [Candidatus Nanohaloarchaea archaeon]